MTMKIIRLTTYWDADQANTIIDFLDTITEELWETYGEQVTEWHRRAGELQLQQTDPLGEDDDDIDF